MIKKPELVWTTDYTNVLIADTSIVVFLVILSWLWREQRLVVFVAAMLYAFFTVMWHYPPGLIKY